MYPRGPMSTQPVSLRLLSCFPSSALGAEVAALGGRCFTVRHPGAPADGDLIVAVPGPERTRQVLLPRGLGRPLLARAAPGGWLVEGSGETCSPRRWITAGGLAARVRRYQLPKGPAAAQPRLSRSPVVSDGLAPTWLAVRLECPLYTPLTRVRPELRGAPVAVCAGRVRDVSPEARAAGVTAGMALRRALRRCPTLRLVDPPPTSATAEVRALLELEVGEVREERRGLLVRIAAGSVGELFAAAERIALRIWQATGVRVRLAIAADGEIALRFARLLAVDSVAYVPASAAAAWRRQRPRPGSPSMPDVEGIVAAARAAADHEIGAGRLVLEAAGGRVELVCTSTAPAAAQAEAALRARALRLGEVAAVRWVPAVAPAAVAAAAQLSLRLAR